MAWTFKEQASDQDDTEAALQLLSYWNDDPSLPDERFIEGCLFITSFHDLDGNGHYLIRTIGNDMRKMQAVGLCELAKLEIIDQYREDDD